MKINRYAFIFAFLSIINVGAALLPGAFSGLCWGTAALMGIMAVIEVLNSSKKED